MSPHQGSLANAFKFETSLTFFSAASDLFITCMLWFIIDEESAPDILRSGDHTYAILQVVEP